MNDLFILYIAFSYLFIYGLIMATWEDAGSKAKLGAFVCLLCSPASMPVIFGATFIK
jgi:hypothetical protein